MADPDCTTGSGCKPEPPSWVNWARNQPVFARCVAHPRKLDELAELVREVGARGGRLRAVATGLSFSDILQTDDTLVVLTELLSPDGQSPLLPLEDELWHDPTPLEARVRVPAGARVRELNAALLEAGLGFENLGGYDGQTLIGAISTSTHGSGIRFGPLCNAVRSLDLMTTGGKLYRIEPGRGAITDPAKFRALYGDDMTLVQHDDWFQSAVVALGCLGIIVAMTVAVVPAYRLSEQRRLKPWSELRRELAAAPGYLAHRNYEVLLNPYPRRDGDHSCLVTERDFAPLHAQRVPLPASRIDAEDFAFRQSTQRGLLSLLNEQPRLTPTILEAGLDALRSDPRGHLDDSHRIYNIGKINTARVLSAEHFIPLAGHAYLRAVDKLLEIIASNRRRGVYQTSPLSLRFVAGADAYLSMLHGGPRCAIEVPTFTEADGAREALLSYEQALYAFEGRPHWGQMQEFTGARGWLRHAYEKAETFCKVHAQLNHQHLFDNPFTARLRLWD